MSNPFNHLVILSLQRSPTLQTNLLVGYFFVVSYRKLALEEIMTNDIPKPVPRMGNVFAVSYSNPALEVIIWKNSMFRKFKIREIM